MSAYVVINFAKLSQIQECSKHVSVLESPSEHFSHLPMLQQIIIAAGMISEGTAVHK